MLSKPLKNPHTEFQMGSVWSEESRWQSESKKPCLTEYYKIFQVKCEMHIFLPSSLREKRSQRTPKHRFKVDFQICGWYQLLGEITHAYHVVASSGNSLTCQLLLYFIYSFLSKYCNREQLLEHNFRKCAKQL